MVYMYRRDGTVASAPWDEVYFTAWRNARPYQNLMGLQCHILAEDKNTVLDTFTYDCQGDFHSVLRLWEYLRRYMEEGPQGTFEQTPYCLPIGDRKEPFWFGFVRLMLNFNGVIIGQIIFAPVFLVFAIGRAIATFTCRIPRWPLEVEYACAIEPGDPFEKNWRSNPFFFPGMFSRVCKFQKKARKPEKPELPPSLRKAAKKGYITPADLEATKDYKGEDEPEEPDQHSDQHKPRSSKHRRR